jgi:hypothetical protein
VVRERGQQLSSLSSPLSYWRPPWGPILQHGVEHGQQLSHARGEYDLLGFPGRAQTLVERANDGIEARRHECAHREGCADLCTSAPDRALPTPRPGVTIQGGLPHQRGDLFAGQRAKFRQRRQERRRQHRPDAGRAPQELLFLVPHRAKSRTVSGIDDDDRDPGGGQHARERDLQPGYR